MIKNKKLLQNFEKELIENSKIDIEKISLFFWISDLEKTLEENLIERVKKLRRRLER